MHDTTAISEERRAQEVGQETGRMPDIPGESKAGFSPKTIE